MYSNSRPVQNKTNLSIPIEVPVAKRSDSPVKQEEPTKQKRVRAKKKERVNIPSVIDPPIRNAKRDDGGIDALPHPTNEPATIDSDIVKRQANAEEHAPDPLFNEQPANVAVNTLEQAESSDADKLTEVASLPKERELPLPGEGDNRAQTSYLAMVKRRISNNWYAPSTVRAMEVVIEFKLAKSGDVSDVSIEESSGNEYFDMAAKRAVLSASPLPAFYQNIEVDHLTAHMRFSNEP